MRSNPHSLRKNTKAASPAVSAVIITAATVVLVLVSSLYALQVLTRQEAQSELGTVQDSILVFDDAVRDIAWDRDGSRSVRFATQYGNMLLIDGEKSFEIKSAIGSLYNFTTAVVKYQMPYGYGTSGSGSSYILGDNRTIVSSLADSLGQTLVVHESELTSITLSYRVRVSVGGPIEVNGKTVNYVDIFVVRLTCATSEIPAGDFNLVCKNVGLTTTSHEYPIDAASSISISNVKGSDTVHLALTGDSVVFNLIVAEVRVST